MAERNLKCLKYDNLLPAVALKKWAESMGFESSDDSLFETLTSNDDLKDCWRYITTHVAPSEVVKEVKANLLVRGSSHNENPKNPAYDLRQFREAAQLKSLEKQYEKKLEVLQDLDRQKSNKEIADLKVKIAQLKKQIQRKSEQLKFRENTLKKGKDMYKNIVRETKDDAAPDACRTSVEVAKESLLRGKEDKNVKFATMKAFATADKSSLTPSSILNHLESRKPLRPPEFRNIYSEENLQGSSAGEGLCKELPSPMTALKSAIIEIDKLNSDMHKLESSNDTITRGNSSMVTSLRMPNRSEKSKVAEKKQLVEDIESFIEESRELSTIIEEKKKEKTRLATEASTEFQKTLWILKGFSKVLHEKSIDQSETFNKNVDSLLSLPFSLPVEETAAAEPEVSQLEMKISHVSHSEEALLHEGRESKDNDIFAMKQAQAVKSYEESLSQDQFDLGSWKEKAELSEEFIRKKEEIRTEKTKMFDAAVKSTKQFDVDQAVHNLRYLPAQNVETSQKYEGKTLSQWKEKAEKMRKQ